MRLYHLSAEQDYSPAQYNLARLFEKQGKFDDARIWYHRAKQRGNRRALYRLSKLEGLLAVNGWKQELDLKTQGKKTALIVSEENDYARRFAEKAYQNEDMAKLRAEGIVVGERNDMIDYLIEWNKSSQNPVINIAFRGSQFVMEDHVKTNANYFHLSLDDIDENDKGMVELYIGKIVMDVVAVIGEDSAHGGFIRRYKTMRAALIADIDHLLSKNKLNYSEVYFIFSGHSLGGAIASLAAREFKINKPQSAYIGLVTVSSPRVFGTQAAKETEQLLGKKNIMRWWREGDPVPLVPPVAAWFDHLGTDYKVKPLNGASMFDIKNKHNLKRINSELQENRWRLQRTGAETSSCDQPGILETTSEFLEASIATPAATGISLAYAYSRVGLYCLKDTVTSVRDSFASIVHGGLK